MATIGLLTHRAARPLERLTGIGRYAVGLASALVARDTDRFVLLAPFDDEPTPGTWPSIPLVRLGGNRRTLLARWRATGRPVLDDLVPGLDLVHVLAPIVPVPTRVPLVVTVHDLFPLDHPAWTSGYARWGFGGAVAQLGRAAHVVVPSEHVRAQVLAQPGVAPERVTVVPEGVDDEFRAAGRGTGDRSDGAAGITARLGIPATFLLAVGSISERKNLGVVLAALAQLPAHHRPDLVIAGTDGDAAATLEALTGRLGLSRYVHRVGFVDDADLPHLMGGATALVQPSLDEGFGLPVAEAMAAGVPVIAARAGALPELIGDAGTLVDPHDVAGWAAALASVDRRHVAAARARAGAWTWDRAAAAHEEVYLAALTSAVTGPTRR